MYNIYIYIYLCNHSYVKCVHFENINFIVFYNHHDIMNTRHQCFSI